MKSEKKDTAPCERELMRFVIDTCAGRGKRDLDAEKRLAEDIGSISRLLFASPAGLRDSGALSESGIRRLRLIRAMFVLTELEKLGKHIPAEDEGMVKRYVSLLFLPHTAEAVYLIPVTGKYLGEPYLLSQGTDMSVDIDPERIRTVLGGIPSCKEFILCHSHPHTTCEPSEGDIEATTQLFGYLFTCGFTLRAHYIAGTDGVGKVGFDSDPMRYFFGR